MLAERIVNAALCKLIGFMALLPVRSEDAAAPYVSCSADVVALLDVLP
jgi:hypothetical protein